LTYSRTRYLLGRAAAVALAAALLPGCLAGMPERVKVFWTGAAVVLGLLVAIATAARFALARKARKRYERAVVQVETGQPELALPIIRAGKRWELNPAGRERWDALEMSAYVQMNDIGSLVILYDESPKPFTTDEEAALLAARAQVETGRLEAFSELRRVWVAREGKVDQWLGLESDLLELQEQPEEAITLLKRFKFDGPPEGRRLARLGYLLAERDPALAAKAMDLAVQFGPKLADVWLFSGRYHERAGHHKAAYTAYARGFECAPRDFFVRNHLAQFLVRQGAYTQAIQAWSEATAPPSMDFIWLKALFWKRVANAEAGGEISGLCPEGNLKRLVEALRKLDDTRFWDETRIDRQLHEERDLPEVAWLRVLEALRQGQDDEALSLLNLGLRSAHPMLENGLRQALTYRRTGFFEPGVVCLDANTPPTLQHPLLVRMDAWINGTLPNEPAELVRMLETRAMYPALLAACGWHAAAARLQAAL
jgi:tetratricopeptide (TPR) repeat protein